MKQHPLMEDYKYYLSDNIHFFMVKKGHDDEKRVLFFKGNIYLANEGLMGRDLDVLKAELEGRKSAI
ncbi:MAG TPA: hypothetical protein VEB40_14035 [Flavipsychrobacter sp.]|nr:hypothetical protein [Flavipsychrobacter sp.]